MSGGSWDYAFYKFEDVAVRLTEQKCPSRRALGEHLFKIADAMKAIEWVDSGDTSPPTDTDAIRKVFENDYAQREMEVLLTDARSLIAQLKEYGA